jgi:L-serine deaminase
MDFLEIEIIAALIAVSLAVLVYLMRYSNKRLVEMIQELEERLSIHEKVSAKNSRKLQEMKQLAGSGSKESAGKIEKNARKIRKRLEKAVEIMSKSVK